MISIKINNLDFLVKKELSILEACKFLGFLIPRFCYHESLSVVGNCRMCLVEVQGNEKPVASCVTEIENNMSIWLDTVFVKKARENVVETLLINHPLDCPICDQAGECDLQDQTKVFGSDYSRQFYNKTGVEDKDCGPIIKTIMTRCIHCTRCVRFCDEIAGINFFGTLNRGGSTEIGAYISRIFESDISGNVIDLCPVGALTSKSYAFKARPWEMKMTESVDISDGVGSNVYINYKELNIFRVIPKYSKAINDAFISDKTRYSFDSLKNNRISNFYKKNTNKLFLSVDPFTLLSDYDNSIKSLILINDYLGFYQTESLKRYGFYTNKNLIIKKVDLDIRKNFYFQNDTNSIEDLNVHNFSYCFLLSSNLKLEASMINLRLRLKFKKDFLKIYNIGSFYNSDFIKTFINLNNKKTLLFIEGKHAFFKTQFFFEKNVIFILGSNINKEFDKNIVSNSLKRIFFNSCILNVNTSANSEGLSFLDIKTVTTKSVKNVKSIVSTKLDDSILSRKILLKEDLNKKYCLDCFGSGLTLEHDYIIPTVHYLEEEDIFFNLEKRPQKTNKVFNSYKNIKEINSVFELFYNKALRKSSSNYFDYIKELILDPSLFESKSAYLFEKQILFGLDKKKVSLYPTKNKTEDLYVSNSFDRNSKTMQECSQKARVAPNFFS